MSESYWSVRMKVDQKWHLISQHSSELEPGQQTVSSRERTDGLLDIDGDIDGDIATLAVKPSASRGYNTHGHQTSVCVVHPSQPITLELPPTEVCRSLDESTASAPTSSSSSSSGSKYFWLKAAIDAKNRNVAAAAAAAASSLLTSPLESAGGLGMSGDLVRQWNVAYSATDITSMTSTKPSLKNSRRAMQGLFESFAVDHSSAVESSNSSAAAASMTSDPLVQPPTTDLWMSTQAPMNTNDPRGSSITLSTPPVPLVSDVCLSSTSRHVVPIGLSVNTAGFASSIQVPCSGLRLFGIRPHMTCRLVPLSTSTGNDDSKTSISSAAQPSTDAGSHDDCRSTVTADGCHQKNDVSAHQQNTDIQQFTANRGSSSSSARGGKGPTTSVHMVGSGRRKRKRKAPHSETTTSVPKTTHQDAKIPRKSTSGCSQTGDVQVQLVTTSGAVDDPFVITSDCAEAMSLSSMKQYRVPPLKLSLIKTGEGGNEKIWATVPSAMPSERSTDLVAVSANHIAVCTSSSESAIGEAGGRWLVKDCFGSALAHSKRNTACSRSSSATIQPTCSNTATDISVGDNRVHCKTLTVSESRATRVFSYSQLAEKQKQATGRNRSGSLTDTMCRSRTVNDYLSTNNRTLSTTTLSTRCQHKSDTTKSEAKDVAKTLTESRQYSCFPDDIDDYLTVTGEYCLHEDHPFNCEVIVIPYRVIPSMRELYVTQQRERVQLRQNQIQQQNHLMLTIESEVLREYTRYASRSRALASCHPSACSTLWPVEAASKLNGTVVAWTRSDVSSSAAAAAAAGDDDDSLTQALDNLHHKFNRIRAEQMTRWSHEADCLHAMQTQDWEWKRHEFGPSSDTPTTKSCVPRVVVDYQPISQRFQRRPMKACQLQQLIANQIQSPSCTT